MPSSASARGAATARINVKIRHFAFMNFSISGRNSAGEHTDFSSKEQTIEYTPGARLRPSRRLETAAALAYKRGLRNRRFCDVQPAFISSRKRGIMSSVTSTPTSKGLEGVVATTSSICYIDGDQGVLAYRGFDIHDLADHSTFEEVCYLLWFGRLPKADELQSLKQQLAEERKLDASILHGLELLPKHVLPMDVLRTLVSMLSYYDPEFDRNDHEANIHK